VVGSCLRFGKPVGRGPGGVVSEVFRVVRLLLHGLHNYKFHESASSGGCHDRCSADPVGPGSSPRAGPSARRLQVDSLSPTPAIFAQIHETAALTQFGQNAGTRFGVAGAGTGGSSIEVCWTFQEMPVRIRAPCSVIRRRGLEARCTRSWPGHRSWDGVEQSGAPGGGDRAACSSAKASFYGRFMLPAKAGSPGPSLARRDWSRGDQRTLGPTQGRARAFGTAPSRPGASG